MNTLSKEISKHSDFIKEVINKNGPAPVDYPMLDEFYQNLWLKLKTSELAAEDIVEWRDSFGEVFNSAKTLFGFVNTQPHGYPGDFEIIDKIYKGHISKDADFVKWDNYFQSLSACKAVRNRKQYFKNLLQSKSDRLQGLEVLNLASGPCRDLLEFFQGHNPRNHQIDCVELDENAIKYATNLLGEYASSVRFIHQNVFKFMPSKTYDLIWSAGLFDYFDDRIFVRMLSRFLKQLRVDGEIVIGNFHPRNPNRGVMEFGRWNLNHRTETELVVLAKRAGVTDFSRITIEQEEEGVNLFMRIKA